LKLLTVDFDIDDYTAFDLGDHDTPNRGKFKFVHCAPLHLIDRAGVQSVFQPSARMHELMMFDTLRQFFVEWNQTQRSSFIP